MDNPALKASQPATPYHGKGISNKPHKVIRQYPMPAKKPVTNASLTRKPCDTQRINPGASHAGHGKLMRGKEEAARSAPQRTANRRRNLWEWPEMLNASACANVLGTQVFCD